MFTIMSFLTRKSEGLSTKTANVNAAAPWHNATMSFHILTGLLPMNVHFKNICVSSLCVPSDNPSFKTLPFFSSVLAGLEAQRLWWACCVPATAAATQTAVLTSDVTYAAPGPLRRTLTPWVWRLVFDWLLCRLLEGHARVLMRY